MVKPSTALDRPLSEIVQPIETAVPTKSKIANSMPSKQMNNSLPDDARIVDGGDGYYYIEPFLFR